MSAPARSPIQPSTRMPLSRTENSVLRDLLDHRSGNTALRSHAQTAIDTAMKHKSISQSAVRTLEQKGYLWRLNKDRDVLYCEFPPDVIEAFAPKPLDRDYYKTLCLYIRFLGKKLSPPENSVARVIAECVSGPRHLCVVGIDRVAERVDMSRGGAGDQIRALRTRRILALTGSNYHGGHRTNTYRFRGVRRFLNSAQVATAEADAPARPVTWKPSQLKEKLSSFLLKLPAERDGGRVASRSVITKELRMSGWSIDRLSAALEKEGWTLVVPPPARGVFKPPTIWYPKGCKPGVSISARKPIQEGFRHSDDFRSVTLNGESFTLTTNEAQVVAMLAKAHENGTPDLSGEAILDTVGACKRVRDLFSSKRRHIFNKLIRSGEARGTYRLNL